jgi:hypothetical protein
MDIKNDLNQLAEMRSQLDVINLHYQDLRKSIIPVEIQEQLDDMEAEHQSALDAAKIGISELEKTIKADVLIAGISIKGDYLQAVWNKPRVTWNTKALAGFAAAHPEILDFRKVGKPSVTIRKR